MQIPLLEKDNGKQFIVIIKLLLKFVRKRKRDYLEKNMELNIKLIYILYGAILLNGI